MIMTIPRGKRIEKKCKNCENEFEALLIKVRQGKGLFCSKDCYTNYRKKNSKDKKYLNRIYQKKHRYGLTEDQYLKMFEDQENKCSICGTSFEEKRACVDHSHESGDVRGLLCDKCNRGLGNFDDDIEILKNAIEYLNVPPHNPLLKD